MCEAGDVVFPGDEITESSHDGKIILGPGLSRDCESIIINKTGILRHRQPNIYWVDSHQKRYVPVKNESVMGIVTAKAGDIYRVDIGSSCPASLSYLSFEGSTKRNRPDVKVGDLVFCKLLVANKDMEPEVVCIDGAGRSNGMGVIRTEGYMFSCSLNLVRKILSPECSLLKQLGNKFPYEIAVGMNGRIWLKGQSNKETIALMNVITRAEFLSESQIKGMTRRVGEIMST